MSSTKYSIDFIIISPRTPCAVPTIRAIIREHGEQIDNAEAVSVGMLVEMIDSRIISNATLTAFNLKVKVQDVSELKLVINEELEGGNYVFIPCDAS